MVPLDTCRSGRYSPPYAKLTIMQPRSQKFAYRGTPFSSAGGKTTQVIAVSPMPFHANNLSRLQALRLHLR